MKIAIIGAAGRMGSWLSQHFTKRGDSLVLYDLKLEASQRLAKKLRQNAAQDLKSAVKGSEAIFVSVPLDATPRVLKSITPHLKGREVVGEVASLKTETVKILRGMQANCDLLLSIHPLFGPGVRSLKGKKIILTPIADRENEMKMAKKLFPGVVLLESSADEHDRLMALALNMTHFINAVFVKIVSNEDLKRLRDFGGTSFTLQLLLAESILHDDPSLLAAIQFQNSYGANYLERYLQEASKLRELVKKDMKNTRRYFSLLRKAVSKDPEFVKSYRKTYTILESALNS
ncbi:MAG: prephenate dehydrogenase/arogenate dehydrogenase family protein [Thaumarchaeota archaeon]|nr:prephenate dehydrogenase/arogenate dehydrogenase family protein [Nitrososphaerota archaeon]